MCYALKMLSRVKKSSHEFLLSKCNTNREITARERFLDKEISVRERFPGQRNLWLRKVSWAEKSLAGKGFPRIERKGYWEGLSSRKMFPWQIIICPGKVFGKSSLPR